jgi:hypothetical protein
MNRTVSKSFCLLCMSLLAASAALADTKSRTKNTASGRSYETTTYIKGARQRTEQSVGMGLAMVNQCDLKRIIQLNDKARTYLVISTDPQNSPKAPATPEQGNAAKTQKPEGRKGGIVTYTTTLTDTGERKQILGLTARHIKSSLTVESSPDACRQSKMKIETDGWYVDFKDSLYCPSDGSEAAKHESSEKAECEDEVRYKTVGEAKLLGFPVLQTVTSYQDDGRTNTSTTEVLELATKPLDAKLFDIPAGYKEAKDYQELMGIGAGGVPSMSGINASIPGMPGQAGADSTEDLVQLKIEPKHSGVIRIGVTAINNKTDRPAPRNVVREQLISAINSGNIEAVPIYAKSSNEIDAEAKQTNCDFVLYTEIATLKQSGGGGMLGKVTKAAGVNPLKDKFESKVEYKLYAAGAASAVLSSSASAKAGGGISVSSALQMGMGVAMLGFNPMGAMGGMSGLAGMPGMGGMGGMGMGMMGFGGGPMALLMRGGGGGLGGFGMNMAMGGLGGGFGPGSAMGQGGHGLAKEEHAALSSAIEQEAKAVVAATQKK